MIVRIDIVLNFISLMFLGMIIVLLIKEIINHKLKMEYQEAKRSSKIRQS